MVKHVVALVNLNSSRYGICQGALLEYFRNISYAPHHDLLVKGSGGSLTLETFSAIPGNIIPEIFNKETEVRSGPFGSRSSANTIFARVSAFGAWILERGTYSRGVLNGEGVYFKIDRKDNYEKDCHAK